MDKRLQILIIGGGPAGLMAAESLSHYDLDIHVFDQKPSLARKFLMAGKSGLNITHSESFAQFVTRYGIQSDRIGAILKDFDPDDIQDWCDELGIQTFKGSSGRVFPEMMKASPLLRNWLTRLTERSVQFHTLQRWIGISSTHAMQFEQTREGTISEYPFDAVIFAMGGGSWAKLGSDGLWMHRFQDMGIATEPFQASNCALTHEWSTEFRDENHGKAVKTIALTYQGQRIPGDFIITKTGIEGGTVYGHSSEILKVLKAGGAEDLIIDLLPNRSQEWIFEQLSKPRGRQSWSTHIGKSINIKGIKAALLRELLEKENYMNAERLSRYIKALPLSITGPGPLDRAISTSGGLPMDRLDENLMITDKPGLFACGEMLNWDAPTGGYLLSACLAQGFRAGRGVASYLKLDEKS